MECQRSVAQVKPFLGEVVGLVNKIEVSVFHEVSDQLVIDLVLNELTCLRVRIRTCAKIRIVGPRVENRYIK